MEPIAMSLFQSILLAYCHTSLECRWINHQPSECFHLPICKEGATFVSFCKPLRSHQMKSITCSSVMLSQHKKMARLAVWVYNYFCIRHGTCTCNLFNSQDVIRFGNKIVEEEHDVSSIKVIFKTSNLNIRIHLCEQEDLPY